MHMDPALPNIVLVTFVILCVGLVLRLARQPHVMGYILAGIVLGAGGLGIITDSTVIARMGEYGVVLLLFFIGMEVVPEKLFSAWKISVVGTVVQILLSVIVVALLGFSLDWSMARIVLIGFVISLSSTAVVLNILSDSDELNTPIGQDVLGVLLVQDLAIIIMLIILNFLSGEVVSVSHIAWQILGALLMGGLAVFIIMKKVIHFPIASWIRKDHELQIFSALVICFGLAYISALFELSTALGAFLGGMLIGRAKETQWFHNSLEPFRVIFVAFFFLSIGLLFDLDFLIQNIGLILLVVVAVFLTNGLINVAVMRSLGYSWNNGIYAGVLLSQIGEFSFVLAAIGRQSDMISPFAYKLIIAVISITLLMSPILVKVTKKLLGRDALSFDDLSPEQKNHLESKEQ